MVFVEEISLDLLLLGYFDPLASWEHNKTSCSCLINSEILMRDQLVNTVFASFYRKLVLAGEYLDSWEKLFPLKALPIRLNRNRMQSIHFRFRNGKISGASACM